MQSLDTAATNPTSLTSESAATLQRLASHLDSVMIGQHVAVKKIVAALATQSHVLLEDFPGTGKTTLAKGLAKSIEGAVFNRIQFTPDLLPSDVLGVTVFNPKTHEFNFHKGPVFANLLLADEINRASPRTQSALLEAMAESQATIEGTRHQLPDPFFVIATQNPVEFRGTYPLPEAQMDRFALQTNLGYVSVEDEMRILDSNHAGNPTDELAPCISLEDLRRINHDVIDKVHVAESLKRYVVTIVAETRRQAEVQLAASPRASIALVRLASAFALLDDRDYLIPEDIQDLAGDVIAHRLVLDPGASFSGITARDVVYRILESVPVPQ